MTANSTCREAKLFPDDHEFVEGGEKNPVLVTVGSRAGARAGDFIVHMP